MKCHLCDKNTLRSTFFHLRRDGSSVTHYRCTQCGYQISREITYDKDAVEKLRPETKSA